MCFKSDKLVRIHWEMTSQLKIPDIYSLIFVCDEAIQENHEDTYLAESSVNNFFIVSNNNFFKT
jgi:hypothetical protein